MAASRGEYTAVHTALVDEDDFRALTPEAKLAFYTLKMILGPSGIEVVRCFVTQMQGLTGMKELRLRAALDELTKADWLKQQGDVVWLRNGLRYNPNMTLANEKHRISVIRHLEGMPRLGVVNAFAEYYELPVIHTGIPIEWVSVPYTKQVVGRRYTVKGSVSTKLVDEPPVVEISSVAKQPRPANPDMGYWMPMLREQGYNCDMHDGSILKVWWKRGYADDDIEEAVKGLALMRNRGELSRSPLNIGRMDKISLRLLHYEPDDPGARVPLWNEAVDTWKREQARDAKKNLTQIGVLLRKATA